MAGRYLVLAPRDAPVPAGFVAQAVDRTGLRVHASRPRFTILADDDCPLLSIGDGDMQIVGHLFRRFGHGPALKGVEASEAKTLMADPEATLMRRYWGGYAAVWAFTDRVEILRDPSGQMPCCYLETEQYVLFASDPALLFAATAIDPAIDWEGVARLLFANDLAQVRTGLLAVRDLLAGTAITIGADAPNHRSCWSPWDHTAGAKDMGFAEQAERLERVVTQCTRGWVDTFSTPLLGVSGGLDSSIVAACASGRVRLDCVTLATTDERGNETRYADAMCSSLGLPLSTYEYRLDDADICRSAVAHLPRPGARTPMVAYDAAVIRKSQEILADLFLTGAGGDNVFYLTHSVRPLVDRFLAEGLCCGLWDTARDISAVTEVSVVQVLSHVARFGFSRRRLQVWRHDDRFLDTELAATLWNDRPDHAWLAPPTGALPGKAGQIAMITRAQQYLHGYDRCLPFTAIAPLLSQPIVETMLSIPTWQCCAGGRDRSVARAAFASRLPKIIIGRRTKGGPDGFAMQILRHHRHRIRERLLDGRMASKGLLDRNAIDCALSPDQLGRGTGYVRLLLLLDTEAWLDHWCTPGGPPIVPTDVASTRYAR